MKNFVGKVAHLPKNKLLMIGAFVVVFILGVVALYFFVQYQRAQAQLSNPDVYAKEEARKLVASVSKLMVLPTDEEPTVATVADRDKLKEQQFFANSQNGDKVLIYTKAKKAILFRPSANKIIDVAPVNIGAGTPTPAASGSPQVTPTPTKLTLILRNGTETVGLTKSFEDTVVKTKAANVTVVDRENAKKRDYQTSVLVDTTGKKSQEAQALGSALGVSVGKLPDGEATGSADFIIILGADKK
jgi:hypothetical protein